jgi:hypothetical protein
MDLGFFFFLVAPTLGSLLPLLEHRAEVGIITIPNFFGLSKTKGNFTQNHRYPGPLEHGRFLAT